MLFVWFVVVFVLCFKAGFHCIALAIPELAFIDQTGLELRDLPALAPECWDKGKCHHCPAK